MRTKIGIPDILVCAIAILLSISVFLYPISKKADRVLVKTDENEFSYSLLKDSTVTIHSAGHTLTLEIKSGSVRITESDCPDKICVSFGSIKDPSRPIVCAPAKVIVQISGTGGDDDADFIAGR